MLGGSATLVGMYGVIYFTGQRIAAVQMAELAKLEQAQVCYHAFSCHASGTYHYPGCLACMTVRLLCGCRPFYSVCCRSFRASARSLRILSPACADECVAYGCCGGSPGLQEDRLCEEPGQHRAHAMGKHPTQDATHAALVVPGSCWCQGIVAKLPQVCERDRQAQASGVLSCLSLVLECQDSLTACGDALRWCTAPVCFCLVCRPTSTGYPSSIWSRLAPLYPTATGSLPSVPTDHSSTSSIPSTQRFWAALFPLLSSSTAHVRPPRLLAPPLPDAGHPPSLSMFPRSR